jgi:Transposase DDE domain group 1
MFFSTLLEASQVPPIAAKMAVAYTPVYRAGGTQQVNRQKVVGKVGKFNIGFRQEQLTSPAGTVLLQDFARRLGIERVLDEELRVKVRERGYREGQAMRGLVYNLIVGGTHLSDLDVLRGDPGTQELLAAETMLAPTTAGEFLRKFDIGDVQDLQRVHLRLQQRVRAHPQATTCTIDLDSSIYEQGSTTKEGSTKAYNGESGYHPLLAFWAEEGELLFSHLRRGSAYTARNILWFLRETYKRVPATAGKYLRADSGFYSKSVAEWCEAYGFIFTITAEQTAPLLQAIAALPEQHWRSLPEYELAEVAELRYQPTGWPRPYRYVVKRELAVHKTGERYWEYHATVTNDEVRSARPLVVWHLQHAAMENAIKEHKSGFGVEKLPTQKFHANWAYLLIGQLAFKLVAWFKRLGLPLCFQRATIKTIRHQLLNLAGKIIHTARRCFLMISDQYRYQGVWRFAIDRLVHLQFG